MVSEPVGQACNGHVEQRGHMDPYGRPEQSLADQRANPRHGAGRQAELKNHEHVGDERHQGYDGWLHGGILGAILDDVMANWYFLRGVKAVTGRMEVRYRSPVPIGESLRFESWLVRISR